jgi:hypothetical protein
MKRLVLGSVLILGTALTSEALTSAARADVPPQPRDVPEGMRYTTLQVTHDPDKDTSFLYIGRQALEMADPKSEKTGWNTSPTRSILAALSLSLGVAGLFFLRGKRGPQIACGLVLAVGLGSIGAEAWGNAAPVRPDPKYDADKVWNLISQSGQKVFNGDTVIVMGQGRDIRLVIGTKPKPQRQFPRFLEPPTPIAPAPNAPAKSAPPSGGPTSTVPLTPAKPN